MSDKSSRPMAAVGQYDTVLPFQAVGVKPFPVGEKSDEVKKLLERLARENYAVVFVEEALFVENQDLISELNQEYPASMIPIPGIRGSLNVGLSAIRGNVERAVGMDIFAEK
ncbi:MULTISPECIES: V-type ATP synthase subunit F [Dethiosulfovibrio]|uniref:V-type ATP synthase subunit F n=2 Tax=Dethiosulfovibrio TaxID=47054 RepID=A0ABS9EUU1_9BACT|nr:MULTISPECIES: V-type ATP synthase subunit F [Dethiosulfovibrio]MCF4113693.1 V-type ATP synthase subunit F [Dethiosulfovibrio russensis]MCF4143570.1 V-type ATP synthase subunit F [Dethiosulfovibrio marinus]MCF4145959.1 V-type ATP synthase subunit F [Dethiosulfovibrio acidaminovorans]